MRGQTGRSPIPNFSLKRIANRQLPLENLAVLQVFGVEGRAPGLWGKGRDERVISLGFGIS